jgi:hypothetical protein
MQPLGARYSAFQLWNSTRRLITSDFTGRTACLIATGPSLKPQQVEVAKSKGFALFGCNNVWELTELDVLWATNGQWWDHYWSDKLKAYPAAKWTVNRAAAIKYGLNWTAERAAQGLSTDPNYIHHGHGSGYSMLNLAYLMGASRIVLLGYDLKYAPNYDGKARQVGSSPRHYFGEYAPALHHWPSVHVKGGVHVELVSLYESVARQGLVEIINCSPDTALTCFPRVPIEQL